MTDTAKPEPTGAQSIRQAAVQVLLQVGLRAASTRMVTAQAGAARGLLNHYFRWPDLRAEAWATIFDAVTTSQFPPDLPPDQAIEHYLATAFDAEAPRYWLLWHEATDLAASDPAMAAALARASARALSALTACLEAGHRQGHWHLANPDATALRLTALYDGLAGLLLAGTHNLTPQAAEAHLRHTFELEGQPA